MYLVKQTLKGVIRPLPGGMVRVFFTPFPPILLLICIGNIGRTKRVFSSTRCIVLSSCANYFIYHSNSTTSPLALSTHPVPQKHTAYEINTIKWYSTTLICNISITQIIMHCMLNTTYHNHHQPKMVMEHPIRVETVSHPC